MPAGYKSPNITYKNVTKIFEGSSFKKIMMSFLIRKPRLFSKLECSMIRHFACCSNTCCYAESGGGAAAVPPLQSVNPSAARPV